MNLNHKSTHHGLLKVIKRLLFFLLQFFLFFSFSFLHLSYADSRMIQDEISGQSSGVKILQEQKKPLFENPENCLYGQKTPCTVWTGPNPLWFQWKGVRWKMGFNSLFQVKKKGKIWIFYKGIGTVENFHPLEIHTPFGDIFLKSSRAMVQVSRDNMNVLALQGEDLQVKPRLHPTQRLFPGFQNWYAGVSPGGQEMGVPTVLNLRHWARLRSRLPVHSMELLTKEVDRLTHLVYMTASQVSSIRGRLAGSMGVLPVLSEKNRGLASLNTWKRKKPLSPQIIDPRLEKFLRQLFMKKINYEDDLPERLSR